MYQNAIKYIRAYWLYVVVLLLIALVMAGCNSLLRSCSNSVERISNNVAKQTENANNSEVQKLLSKVESLEKQDSVFIEKQKQIDSLRVELRTLKLTISEQYRFLSNRYADKFPKR